MSRDDGIMPGQRLRARGALSNRAGRFEARDRVAADDGWDGVPEARPVQTEVRLERPRSALSYNRSPDLPFDRSINPYRGCEHGCIYCFARPTHAFLNLSPGLDFVSCRRGDMPWPRWQSGRTPTPTSPARPSIA
jgi:hypothetical protein